MKALFNLPASFFLFAALLGNVPAQDAALFALALFNFAMGIGER